MLPGKFLLLLTTRPISQVPAYISAQVLGSTVSIGTLRLLFGGKHGQFLGTVPAGSDLQSLVLEFIISFYLMFVISGVATDSRAVSIAAAMTSSTEFTDYMLASHVGSSVQIGELAGLVVGATVVVNVLFAGYRNLTFRFPSNPCMNFELHDVVDC